MRILLAVVMWLAVGAAIGVEIVLRTFSPGELKDRSEVVLMILAAAIFWPVAALSIALGEWRRKT